MSKQTLQEQVARKLAEWLSPGKYWNDWWPHSQETFMRRAAEIIALVEKAKK